MISEYDTLKLKEVTTYISRGITPSYDEKGVRVINQRCVRDKKLNLNDSRVTNPEKRNIPEKKYLRKYDVLVNSTGVGTLGRVAQIKEDLKELLTADSHVTIIRPDKKIVDGLYFGYALMNAEPHITFLGEGSTGQIELSRKLLASEVEINVPPFEIQKKIAKILNSLDDKIELNQRMNQTLEEIGRAIFKHWFVDFEFPDEQGRPYKSSGGEMVDSELGEIPKGWEIKEIGKVIETTGGGTPSTKKDEYWENGNIQWFSPRDITSNGQTFIFESEKKINKLGLNKSSANLFPAYSVMMTSRATVGELSINIKEACTNQGFITCIPNDKLSSYYIYFWIEMNKENIIGLAGGSTFREINKSTFRSLKVVVPSKNVLVKYNSLLNSIFGQIEDLQAQNNNLSKIRDSLLPKLMSGRIRVKLGGLDEDRKSEN